MKQSEKIDALSNALWCAQAEMGGAVKDSSNPFFKSNYADLTAVIKAIKQPLSNHGISYVQFPINEGDYVGVCTRIMHTSGQWLENDILIPLTKKDPQSVGSIFSYIRRYSLSAIFGLPSVDDDAESAMVRGDDKKIITDDQVISIKKLLDETNTDNDKFCAWLKVNSVDHILAIHYDRAVAALEAKK
ncbi:MAG: ERF family protein [Porticoccaceae bacterium]|jgi:hypothetical protein